MGKRVIALAIIFAVAVFGVWYLTKREPPPSVPREDNLEQPGAVSGQQERPGQNDGGLGNRGDDEPDYGVYPGDRAYDFELRDIEGNLVKLSDYEGKVVVITFWQTTCSWCRKVLPKLDRLYKTYKDGDLAVVALNIGEAADRVSQVVEDEGFTFPVLLDTKADVAKRYLISALPTSFIITGDGVISATHIGYMEYSQMEGYIETAFKER